MLNPIIDLRLRLLDEMTTDQIDATFSVSVGDVAPFVIVVGPEADATDLPDQGALGGIVDDVADSTPEAREDDTDVIESLMDAPDPAVISVRDVLAPSEIAVITLENGARVAMLPTEIRQDVVVFGAWSPGGWSLYPTGDVTEAKLISEIVVQSGVADANQIELDRFLIGQLVSVTPYIDETEEG